MKSISIFLLIFTTLIGCSKNCKDYYILDSFELYNSNQFSTTDDIVIKAYKNDCSFTVLKDSFKIVKFERIDNPGYEYNCTLNKRLDPYYDYDFYFIKTKYHCKITGIKVKKEKCNDGLFEDDYSYSFDGYYVDGNLFMCDKIKVFDIFDPNKVN